MNFRQFSRLSIIVIVSRLLVSSNCYAQALDKYGGVTEVPCSNGPASHFYTEKIGDRWWICDPAGHGFFMKGLVGVSYSWPASQNQIQAKYGSARNPYVTSASQDPANVWPFNYMIEQMNRISAWGFNFLADGASGMIWPTSKDVRWGTPDHTIPDQYRMPFDLGMNTTRYAMLPQVYTNLGCNPKYPLKDMMSGIGPTYNAWHYNFGDYFDPYFNTCVSKMWNPTNTANALAQALDQSAGASQGDYLAYIYLDEGDQTGFLDAGPGFPTISNSGLPNNPVTAAAHPAWVALTTAPMQSSAAALGYAATYSDKEVYSKVQLASDVANRYICTGSGTPLGCCTGDKTGSCSIDPASSSYIGSANMTMATTALNSAWGAKYTTLASSDPNCRTNLSACLRMGTYASWGKGTGLLDENGTCPSRGASSCWAGDDFTLKGETAAMQADMSAFLQHYVDHYFRVMTGWIHKYAPGVLTQMTIGGFGAPPRKEVLEAAGKYLDLPQLSVPPNCPTCTDTQRRIDFVAQYLGDKPWMMWEGFFANPDSAESQHARDDNMATTQAGRGAAYQAMVSDLINAKDSGGTHHVVGFYWWAMYDMNGEGLNWGLCTSSDNPYDGKSARVAAGVDKWGYSTGGERTNYGDFISAVKGANETAVAAMHAPAQARGRSVQRRQSSK